jgi:NADH-quinone oxidoreductase subunit L
MPAYILALPFLGFLLLSLGGRSLPKNAVAIIGAGTIVIAALMTIVFGIHQLQSPSETHQLLLWNWFTVGDLSVAFRLRVDALTLVFIFIITFVGALIHIYSTAYMKHDRDYARFFASMNLFVGSMLLLVMADNLVLLYLGWEGVGLCSYLLIGFWYETPANCNAANKAFLVTRIGDTAMLIGLFLLYHRLGTFDIQTILQQSPHQFAAGGKEITLIAFLLLAGGMGKSAQIPLQTWLPDAMAGPSPVSALIHAATMVTAGVYLIARMHVVFLLSPQAMAATAIIGGVTLFVAGCSAMVQTDIKRVLAYSTISQIGYMFLALGLGAWGAAIFHFFTHAFFKALLFLAAGTVIESLHHEQDIFRMGGLRKSLPLVFCTFLAGAAALAALPFVTAGFFSKDPILWYAWSAKGGNALLYLLALTGAGLTAFYSTRLVLVVFGGEQHNPVHEKPGAAMSIPLIILAILALTAGFIEWPHNLLRLDLFSGFIGRALPDPVLKDNPPSEGIFQLVAMAVTLLGVYTGYLLYRQRRGILQSWQRSARIQNLRLFFLSGWGFDTVYRLLLVRPFLFVTSINKPDWLDWLNKGIAKLSLTLSTLLSVSQNGSLRWYIAGVLIGVLFIITLQLVL